MTDFHQFQLPPRPNGNADEKAEQIYRYLYRLVDELNRLLQRQSEKE